MSSQQNLIEQLAFKNFQIEDIVQKISALSLRIVRLSQNFYRDAAKIQQKINKVQFSRPRGNPANQ